MSPNEVSLPKSEFPRNGGGCSCIVLAETGAAARRAHAMILYYNSKVTRAYKPCRMINSCHSFILLLGCY
jgi:hypothetical protein